MKILMTGATGLIGSHLVPYLQQKGHTVTQVCRQKEKQNPSTIYADLIKGEFQPADFEGYDAVIHLAGENIASGRWTEEKKRRIRDSRVLATQALAKLLAQLQQRPRLLISASAIGYYGNRGDTWLTEESSKGEGFLADVCAEWEQAAQPARDAGITVIHPRLGVVLTTEGGALQQLITPFKLCLGGVVGSGDQYMSWIALDDLLTAFAFMLENNTLQGPVNVVSPNPVTNSVFTHFLGKVLHRPTVLPMPAMAARMAFGEVADALLLCSVRVRPQKLEQAGFSFTYPEIEGLLQAYLHSPKPAAF